MRFVEIILAFIASFSGIGALIISIWGVNKYEREFNMYSAVDRFLSDMQSEEMIEAKKYVYCMGNKGKIIDTDDKKAGIVVNHMHHWGLLAKKGYLPLWVFEEGSGGGAVRLYKFLANYINNRREAHGDTMFASGFEWLYEKYKDTKWI